MDELCEIHWPAPHFFGEFHQHIVGAPAVGPFPAAEKRERRETEIAVFERGRETLRPMVFDQIAINFGRRFGSFIEKNSISRQHTEDVIADAVEFVQPGALWFELRGLDRWI